MKNKALLFWLALLLLVGGGLTIWTAVKMSSSAQADSSDRYGPEIPAPEYDPDKTLTRFTLVERTGREVTSESLEGEIWVASFFFSSCPATCMQQNLKIKQLYDEFAPNGVKFVSITCDPQTDRPSVLSNYAKRLEVYSQDWMFLTGNLQYIIKVGEDFFQQPVKQGGHTEYLVVFDRRNKIAGYYHWSDPDQYAALQEKIVELLITPGGFIPDEEPELSSQSGEPAEDQPAAGKPAEGEAKETEADPAEPAAADPESETPAAASPEKPADLPVPASINLPETDPPTDDR